MMTTSAVRTQMLGRTSRRIPVVGLGVFQVEPGKSAADTVASALALGYRHIDTAAFYGNERDVGLAIRQSGIPREEIFVTTKIWNDDQGFDRCLKAGRKALQKLNCGYIDLLLLHSPVKNMRIDSYRALLQLRAEGVVKDVGVSNYGIHHIQEIEAAGLESPACNQIELHPFLQHRKLVDYCQEHQITVVAYSPLVKARRMGHPVVVKIASETGRTPAQVLLKWGLQKNFVVLPKSVSAARQAENLDCDTFQLSEAQVKQLDGLEEGLTTGWDPTVWD